MKPMKPLKYTLLLVGLCIGMTSLASAIPIPPFEFGENGTTGPGNDIRKNGTGIGGDNGNNEPNNFFRLQTVVGFYNANTVNPLLPTPIEAGFQNTGTGTISVTGFDYLVLHYGVGTGGTHGSGGGVECWFVGGLSSFTIPQLGSGPNGFGGISSATLFNGTPTTTPDGGTTAMLLGGALTGLGVVRRYVKR
jgi:hypothetical protein